MDTVLDRISRKMNELTPQERKAAEFIAENYKDVAFLNSSDLAKRAGVGGSTIIRMATSLGYAGFPELHKALFDYIQNKITTIDRLSEITSSIYINKGIDAKQKIDNKLKNISNISKVFLQEAELNISVLDELDIDKFNNMVDILISKERVFIVGSQISEVTAVFATYSLGKVLPEVTRIESGKSNTSNIINSATKNDVAIIFCLPRYPKSTINIMKSLHKAGTTIIVVTHSNIFSYIDMVDILFAVPFMHYKFMDSISPMMSFITALVLEVYERDTKRAVKQLEKFEQFVKCHKVFVEDREK